MNLPHTLHLWLLRHHHLMRRCARMLIGVILGTLTGYGAWWSMTRYVEADARISAAQENERTALALLNGQAQEIMVGDRYIIVTTFEKKTRLMEKAP